MPQAIPSYLHTLSIPTPFPVGPVNVYLAEGEPLTLVDVGPRYDPARESLREALAGRGYRVADLQRIVITHAHADHYGLAAELARVIAPGGVVLCWHVLEVFPEYRRVQREDGTLTPLYSELRTPYPGFVPFDEYFDEEVNRLEGVDPPSQARFWCSRTLGAGREQG